MLPGRFDSCIHDNIDPRCQALRVISSIVHEVPGSSVYPRRLRLLKSEIRYADGSRQSTHLGGRHRVIAALGHPPRPLLVITG